MLYSHSAEGRLDLQCTARPLTRLFSLHRCYRVPRYQNGSSRLLMAQTCPDLSSFHVDQETLTLPTTRSLAFARWPRRLRRVFAEPLTDLCPSKILLPEVGPASYTLGLALPRELQGSKTHKKSCPQFCSLVQFFWRCTAIDCSSTWSF